MKRASNRSKCSFCNNRIIHFPLPHINIRAVLYERETIINAMFSTVPVNFYFHLLAMVYEPPGMEFLLYEYNFLKYCHILFHRFEDVSVPVRVLGRDKNGSTTVVRSVPFFVIVIVGLNTYALQFFLTPAAIAETFSWDRLDINYNKQRALSL